MDLLREILEKSHFLSHSLDGIKKYGKVGIYDAGGDLTKNWYERFTYRNPETGKMERQKNLYLNINSFDTIRDRRKASRIIKEALENLLKNGFNPMMSSSRKAWPQYL